jgi:hypothetical protein
VLCADCGEHLQLKMTQRSLGLAIDAECRKCIASDSYKLLPPFWSGWPGSEGVRPRRRELRHRQRRAGDEPPTDGALKPADAR